MAYRLRTAQAAKLDVREALQYSAFRHGFGAKQRYADLIKQVLADIRREPHGVGTKEYSELGPGILGRHLRGASDDHGVKDPRHIAFYVVDGDTIDVLRVLHEVRHFPRHL